RRVRGGAPLARTAFDRAGGRDDTRARRAATGEDRAAPRAREARQGAHRDASCRGEARREPARALRLGAAFAGALTLFLLPRAAQAQQTPSAPPISNNGYALEFFTGPLIAPTRVTGFGGAFAAAAESVDGAANNAAAPAVREPFSYDWFDFDLN